MTAHAVPSTVGDVESAIVRDLRAMSEGVLVGYLVHDVLIARARELCQRPPALFPEPCAACIVRAAELIATDERDATIERVRAQLGDPCGE